VEDRQEVILGTVYGDVHDIGKDLVAAMLDGTGFGVIDLGVNVEPSEFVRAIKENKTKLVGISALLTLSFKAISDTVDAITEAGLREKVSIMIGGAPITELVCSRTGCDFYGKNAFEGVKIAKKVYSLEP
jgi:methylmalonyl-CoA mutase cobalamin-binding domain/chain